MRIYEPRPVEGFEWAVPIDPADFSVFAELNGTSRMSDWRPVTMELITNDEGRSLRYSEFPWLGTHALVLRPRAAEVVRPIFGDSAELLPLACESAELWVLNVLRIIDALDEEKSEIFRYHNSDRIMTIKKYEFRESRLGGETIFRIPQLLRRGPTFLGERLVTEIEKAGLEAIRFELVWQAAR